MKRLSLLSILMVLSTFCFSQKTQYDYNQRPKKQACFNLLISDFTCSNCSRSDIYDLELPHDIQMDVFFAIRYYRNCSIVDRRKIADLLELSDNENEILSLDDLSETQRAQIGNITKADRVLFGTLKIEEDGTLLVTLEVSNLTTAELDALVRFTIPKDNYLSYSKRISNIEQGVHELIFGNTADSEITEDSAPDDKSVNEAKETAEWEKANNEGTIEAFKEYQRNYPTGKYYEDAAKLIRRLEEIAKQEADESDWETAKRNDNKFAYQEYQRNHPTGKYYTEAEKRIRNIEDREKEEAERSAWWDAQDKGTIEGYENYLYKYPNGKYSLEAEQKIEKLKNNKADEDAWISANRTRSIEAYEQYQRRFPNGNHKYEASTQISALKEELKRQEQNDWNRARSTNTIQSYEQYLRDYPQGTYRNTARDKINELKREIENKNLKWGNSIWVNVGPYKSHSPVRGDWLSDGYFITRIDLDGGGNSDSHDAPVIGRVQASNLAGQISWGNCKWIEVGPQKSHQNSYTWLPEGYFITQFDLDGPRNYSGHDTPIVGQVKACNLVGYPKWGDCKWIEIGFQKSHQASGEWCPDGYFMTQIDLDQVGNASGNDSPAIGRIRCCKPGK